MVVLPRDLDFRARNIDVSRNEPEIVAPGGNDRIGQRAFAQKSCIDTVILNGSWPRALVALA